MIDRPAGAPELTDEMIEAGAVVLEERLDDESLVSCRFIAEKVFRAMLNARGDQPLEN